MRHRHIFVLDGKMSSDFSCYVATSNMFDAPERDVETVEVAGRNGNLVFDNGRFRNFEGSVDCYIPLGMKVNVGALRSWLLTCHSYVRYEDTLHPDEFRLARYSGGFELDLSDRVGASFPLHFDCKPQRFLKLGEQTMSVTNGMKIMNPTDYDALPLIRVRGNGSLTIAGKTINVTGNTSYIDIDCDIQDAYRGTTNMNSHVTQTFPTIPSGVQTITYSGFTAVEITPRWWKI